MRGDIARLGRCTAVTTQSEDTIKRSKPFKYAYEKEIVMYAYFKKLTYFSTECIYSPDGESLPHEGILTWNGDGLLADLSPQPIADMPECSSKT